MQNTNVYLHNDQLARLKKIAAHKGVKRHSSLIREALEEYLEKEEIKIGRGK